MTTVTGDFAVDFSAAANANPFTNGSLTYLTGNTNQILSNALKASGFYGAPTFHYYNGSVSSSATLRSKIEVGANPGVDDELVMWIATSAGTGYYCHVSGTTANIHSAATGAGTGTLTSTTLGTAPVAGDQLVFELNQTTHVFVLYVNGTNVLSVTDSVVTASLRFGWGLWANNSNAATIKSLAGDGVSASGATLSAPTPSGTIGTQTTATIGVTTNQNTGTFYCVVDSAANLSGVTAAQIKLGQKASSAAALAAANSSITTTTPSAGVTGLTAATLYSYAIVQNNANGDSNVVTGTFTTAAATFAASINLVDGTGAALASTSCNWFTQTTYGSTVTGSGTTSTNGSGVLAVTGISASGAGWLHVKSAGNALLAASYQVTFA